MLSAFQKVIQVKWKDVFTFYRIHFAGTETARQWMGYVDGAVESGVRVAEEIAERMKNPDQLLMSKISLTSPVFDKKEPTQKDCNII